MKKASEYRHHAAECRQLAGGMQPGEHRDQMLAMASIWDRLAAERSEMVRLHPDRAQAGEQDEEALYAGAPASIATPRPDHPNG